jgi:phosphate transport system permease protein
MRTRLARHWMSGAMIGLTYVAAVLATLPLLLILAHLLRKGAAALSVSFFTSMPKPVGEAGGGMANAIVGTLILIGIACSIGLPVGIGAGI